MTSLRILVVDDNPGDRTLIVRVLRQEFPQAEILEILEQGGLNRALQSKNFDVVITDFQIRWTNGLDVLNAVKQTNADIPVIMFTNTGTEEIAVEAMKLGLDDYILKQPSRYALLPAAVQRAIERVEIRQRAALLTEGRFQSLSQSLQTIRAISLRLLSDEVQSSNAVGCQDELQQIYQSAETAAQVVQELFRYRRSDLTDDNPL